MTEVRRHHSSDEGWADECQATDRRIKPTLAKDVCAIEVQNVI